MKLKKLQMQGFKSFADRTEIEFDQNIVAVVGPNGCGKSNIVDAIRWTMGEQSAKGLRGKDMADVIFAGTPSRKAAAFAEASLVFNNEDQSAPAPYTECSEIMVTRRLYRTGDSEYLINNVQVRLKDVHDLFLGTGSSAKAYSIVAQGKVDQVVLAKPEDRRFLIEEAAGIAKYKVRKQAAERKMESTNQNLSRVQDILRELERNAKSLERQVERAEKFRELQKELRELDTRVIAAKLRRIDGGAVENDEGITQAKDNLQKTTTLLQEREALLEKHRLESLNFEKLSSSEIESLMQKKEELSKMQTELELGHQKRQLLENQVQEREKDIDRLKGKSRDQAEEQEKLKEQLAQLELEQDSKRKELEEVRSHLDVAETLRSGLEQELKVHQQLLEELRTRAAREAQRREMLQAERIQLELQRAGVEERLEALDSEKSTKAAELKGVEARSGEIAERIVAGEDKLAELRTSYEENLNRQRQSLQKLAEAEKQESDCIGRLDGLRTLEEHRVGYEAGALEFKDKTGLALLMEEISFKPDYRRLGELVMSHLGQSFMGDLPEDVSVQTRWHRLFLLEGELPESNCSQFLSESSPDKHIQLFSRIGFVREIDSTKNCIQLSEAGEFWMPIGAIAVRSQGELKRDESPFSRRQDREDLEVKLEALRADIAHFKTEAASAEQEILNCRAEIQSVEQSLKAERLEQVGLQNKIAQASQALTRLETTQEQNRLEIAEIDARLEELRSQLSQEINSSELQQAEAVLADLQQRVEAARKAKSDAEANWVEYRIAFGALTERLERLRQQCVSAEMTQSEYAHNEGIFQTDIRMWREEMQSISVRREELERLIGQWREEINTHERSLAEVKEKLSVIHRELEEAERDRKEYQSRKETESELLQKLEMERRELKFQVEELSQLLQERYQIGLEDLMESISDEAIQDLQDVENLEKAESQTKILRDRLAKFGDVNLVALQEYEEIKQRLDFMNAQKEDLLRTLDSLQSIIQRINKITEFRFRETFKAINHNFQILFPKLFGGGKAFMKLTDETNLLETGVEIFAEPPGKKVQAMSLLSGGEKAMTSISLLFSLFAYRPSSFCILDEVDAPLDDINTRRYNEIIQEMSSLSQFIVITHNKRTMEVASTLFGVTMQEPGCSRLVGVNLQEARTFTGDAA